MPGNGSADLDPFFCRDITLGLQAVFSGSPAWAHPHWTRSLPEFLTSFFCSFLSTHIRLLSHPSPGLLPLFPTDRR